MNKLSLKMKLGVGFGVLLLILVATDLWLTTRLASSRPFRIVPTTS